MNDDPLQELIIYLEAFGQTIDYECKDTETTLEMLLMASSPDHAKIGRHIGFLFVASQILIQIKNFCEKIGTIPEDMQHLFKGEEVATKFINQASGFFDHPDAAEKIEETVKTNFPAADINMVKAYYVEGAEICARWLHDMIKNAERPDIIPSAAPKPQGFH